MAPSQREKETCSRACTALRVEMGLSAPLPALCTLSNSTGTVTCRLGSRSRSAEDSLVSSVGALVGNNIVSRLPSLMIAFERMIVKSHHGDEVERTGAAPIRPDQPCSVPRRPYDDTITGHATPRSPGTFIETLESW